MKTPAKLAAILLITTSLSGCIPAIIGGAGVGVDTANEDRSTGTKLDDNGIAIKINAKFVGYDQDLAAAAATDVIEGRVLLTGKVKTQAVKDQATKLTWQVNGVKEVINELKVTNEESFSRYATDARISNQIRAKLLVSKGISSANYGVQTVDAIVYLMGIAKNNQEQQAAIEVARRTSGVARVVSHVILRTDPRRGDRAATDLAPETASNANSDVNPDYVPPQNNNLPD